MHLAPCPFNPLTTALVRLNNNGVFGTNQGRLEVYYDGQVCVACPAAAREHQVRAALLHRLARAQGVEGCMQLTSAVRPCLPAVGHGQQAVLHQHRRRRCLQVSVNRQGGHADCWLCCSGCLVVDQHTMRLTTINIAPGRPRSHAWRTFIPDLGSCPPTLQYAHWRCRQLNISAVGTLSTSFAGGTGPIWLVR